MEARCITLRRYHGASRPSGYWYHRPTTVPIRGNGRDPKRKQVWRRRGPSDAPQRSKRNKQEIDGSMKPERTCGETYVCERPGGDKSLCVFGTGNWISGLAPCSGSDSGTNSVVISGVATRVRGGCPLTILTGWVEVTQINQQRGVPATALVTQRGSTKACPTLESFQKHSSRLGRSFGDLDCLFSTPSTHDQHGCFANR
jgi:hypothetical protein